MQIRGRQQRQRILDLNAEQDGISRSKQVLLYAPSQTNIWNSYQKITIR